MALVTVIGNLGDNPEQQENRVKFRMAENNPRTKETTWYNVTAWGKTGELCAEYLEKGKKIVAQGELNFRTYEGKNGPGESKDLDLRSVTFL